MRDSVLISPSILSADLANLGRDLKMIDNADLIHIDVMDGHFTQNLTFGAGVVAAAKRSCDVPLDVHMMVTNPDETIDWYIDAGADYITVHYEASVHLHRTIKHIQERGCKAGVVLNPATPVCVLESIIEELDMVLVMSVNPGFGGQSYIREHLRQAAPAPRSLRGAWRVSPSSRSTEAFRPKHRAGGSCWRRRPGRGFGSLWCR